MDRPVLVATSVTRTTTRTIWQWISPRIESPTTHVLGADDLAAIADALARIAPGERSDGHPLLDLETEFALTARLAELLLPVGIRDALFAMIGVGQRPLLRLLTAPETAAAPWELLPLHAGYGPRSPRLIDAVDIRYELPAAVHMGRRPAVNRPGDATPVYVIDPVVSGWGPILDCGDVQRFRDADPTARASLRAHERTRRGDLSVALRSVPAPSRLVYVGHVFSHEDVGGATSLVLADRPRTYGAAAVIRGGIRPLSAVDLIEGTQASERRLPHLLSTEPGLTAEHVLWPAPPGTSGTEIWPMPPRVLLVGCSSGRDTQLAEPFGLALALVLAGAEYVTAARWKVPTNAWFGPAVDVDERPLVPMLDALDRAHRADDPVESVCAWQRTRSTRWRMTGAAESSGILWSAMTTFHVPRAALRPITDESGLSALYDGR
jgi:hypothetical protein